MEEIRAIVSDSIRTLVVWILQILIDLIFLIAWLFVTSFLNWIIQSYSLTGIDAINFQVFQAIFSFTTLFVIIISLYRDIRIMIIETNKKIGAAKSSD